MRPTAGSRPGPSSGHDTTIDIRPEVTILSVLRHLNYRPWFAVAEFVDNSLQSFLDYRRELEAAEGAGFRLRVSIEIDANGDGHIAVRDNAAGIHAADIARAFRPAEQPPDKSGLCEFGMGMKSAACWFAARWTVRTSALGEDVQRSATVDVDEVVAEKVGTLTVHASPADPSHHFTEIVLSNLHRKPQRRTLGKMKEHLASIYRVFLREGVLQLSFNGEDVAYADPAILEAPYCRDPEGPGQAWTKPIHFDLGGGLGAHGFAALRERASTSSAGFALFRRGRLIEGSGDEGYRPELIFGKPNSFTYQRLFGELHLEGFEISHTKDGFRWEEHEEPFLELLKEELDAEPLPLLDQAEGHRVKSKPEDFRSGAEVAVNRTADAIERNAPSVLAHLNEQPMPALPPAALPVAVDSTTRVIELDFRGNHWTVTLELSADPAVGEWVSISDEPQTVGAGRRKLGVRLALLHPFMNTFGGTEADKIEPLLRVAAAVALAEVVARDRGVKYAGAMRQSINELLANALCQL